MLMIVTPIITLGVFPLVAGTALKKYMKIEKIPVYLQGYFLQFVFMLLFGALFTVGLFSVQTLAYIWLGVCAAITIVFLVLEYRHFLNEICLLPNKGKSFLHDRKRMMILVCEIVLMMGAILLLEPHWDDMTEEVVVAFQNDGVLLDSMYLFHAMLQCLTGIPAVVLVRVVLPIFLLPAFYGACRFLVIGLERYALLSIYAFYGFMVFGPGYLGLEPFLNIWNPVTIGISVCLPAFVRTLIDCKWSKVNLMELLLIGLALQWCIPQGWLYITGFVFAYIVVLLSTKLGSNGRDM